MARIAGMATFFINGASYSTDGQFTVKIQDTKRNPIMDSNGTVHYSEEFVPSMISGNILTTPNLNPDVITALTNATVMVQLKNGSTGMLDEAFFTGDANVTTQDGQMAIEFQGKGRWLN